MDEKYDQEQVKDMIRAQNNLDVNDSIEVLHIKKNIIYLAGHTSLISTDVSDAMDISTTSDAITKGLVCITVMMIMIDQNANLNCVLSNKKFNLNLKANHHANDEHLCDTFLKIKNTVHYY